MFLNSCIPFCCSCHFAAVCTLKPPYYNTCADLKGGGGDFRKGGGGGGGGGSLSPPCMNPCIIGGMSVCGDCWGCETRIESKISALTSQ